jgi:hypothetical protein
MCLEEAQFTSQLGLLTILTEAFCGFPQSLEANAGIVPQISPYRFFPHTLKLIIANYSWMEM